MIDVLVAGGGPAGLAAAIGARLRGLEAVVLEPRRGILDKACGEGLMPGALQELERLGVNPKAAWPFVGIRYVEAGASAEARFRCPGAGVRRTVLHEALVERARTLGVRWHAQRAGPLEQDARGVETAGLAARYLIAADGLHSPIRRELGLNAPPRSANLRFGVRRHFSVRPWTDHVEVHLEPGVEAYVTPVSDHEVGVALLYSAPKGHESETGHRFASLLEAFPELALRLGDPSSSERGSGPFDRPARQRVCGRVLLVGDAAGYLDPITGEGLHLGFASARLAIDAIVRGSPNAYERSWRRRAFAPWLLTDLLLRVRRGRKTAPLLLPALRTAPPLFSLGLRILAGD